MSIAPVIFTLYHLQLNNVDLYKLRFEQSYFNALNKLSPFNLSESNNIDFFQINSGLRPRYFELNLPKILLDLLWLHEALFFFFLIIYHISLLRMTINIHSNKFGGFLGHLKEESDFKDFFFLFFFNFYYIRKYISWKYLRKAPRNFLLNNLYC